MLTLSLVLLIGGAALFFARRTPAGRAAFNVVVYQVRTTWNRWFGGAPPGIGGAVSGTVRDEDGQPLAGATVLVATFEGVVHQAQSDELGSYRIEDVPPGRYVPAAAKWGYEDTPYHREAETRTTVLVRADRLISGVDIHLPKRRPWHPALDEPPVIGPPEIGYALFPTEVSAVRVPITYTNEGLIITTTLLYEPPETENPLPAFVAIYPSAPREWDLVSVALASDGYVVLAVGPSPQRGLDVVGMGRDALKAVAYLRDGQLTDRVGVEREGWLSGSFSSLILYRALIEEPGNVAALVVVGGISDMFLWVQSLHDTESEIPFQYKAAVATLDPPDQHPETYLGLSMVYHAAHLPPTLVVHTTADEVVPYNQSLQFADVLAAAGVTHELYLYEDTSHYLDQVNITPDTAELYRRLAVFADTYVRQGN